MRGSSNWMTLRRKRARKKCCGARVYLNSQSISLNHNIYTSRLLIPWVCLCTGLSFNLRLSNMWSINSATSLKTEENKNTNYIIWCHAFVVVMQRTAVNYIFFSGWYNANASEAIDSHYWPQLENQHCEIVVVFGVSNGIKVNNRSQ